MFDGKQEEAIKEIIENFIESEAFTNLLIDNLTLDSNYRYGSYGSAGSTEIILKWKDTKLATVYVDDCNHGD